MRVFFQSRLPLLRWSACFCLFNTVVFLVAAFRFIQFIDWPQSFLAQIFVPLAFAGHFITVAFLPFAPAFLLILITRRTLPLQLLHITVGSILCIMLVIDSVVFSLYRFHLNGMVWSLIINGGISEILPLSLRTYLIIFAVVLGAIIVEALVAFFTTRMTRKRNLPLLTIIFCSLVIVFSGQILHIWADASNYSPITRQVRVLPGYMPITAKKFLATLGVRPITENTSIQIHANETALNYPLNSLNCHPNEQFKNILILAIDGWRYDMLTKEITPTIYSFSEQSLRFTNHYSAANTTRFGIFSLFYGIYGTYWHAMLAEERGPVLISVLKQNNYQFAVYGSARLNNPEFDRTVFSEIREQIVLRGSGEAAPERDLDITNRFLSFLDSRELSKPFFAFLFYDSSHSYEHPSDFTPPFQPAAATVEHLKLNKDSEPLPIKNRFLNAVNYDDYLIGKVLAKLVSSQLLQNTLVIITSDHGQEFNELGKNYWGHNGNFSRYQTGVPLTIYWPGEEPKPYNHQTSHLDIAPTLLSKLFGCVNPLDDYSTGLLLFDTSAREPLVISNWDRFALLSQTLIDVAFNAGNVDRYDANYVPITSPIPNQLITKAIQGMRRFYQQD